MLSDLKVAQQNIMSASELAIFASSKIPAKKWKCKLSEMIVGEYVITPLTSIKMLKSEGYLMNNCCRDFMGQCSQLTYAVFSIRSLVGERLATLGLFCDENYWRFDQCVGPSNANVTEEIREYLDEDEILQTERFVTELYYISHEVARLMNATVEYH